MRLPILALLLVLPSPAQWRDLSGENLALTPEQSRRIAQNNDAHYAWKRASEARVIQVRAEIEDESVRVPLDPLALGLRYAELEAFRREDLERRDQLVRLNRSVLTEAQQRLAGTLAEVEDLGFIARHADCSYLIYENNPRACGLLSIDFRTPTAPTLPPPPYDFNDPTKPLRDFLALTPEQSAAYLRSYNNLQSRQNELSRSIACAEQVARTALAASPLSPPAIGAAKAESIEQRHAIEALRRQAVIAHQSLLNPAQRERLNLLEQARLVIGTANLAASYAMLSGPLPTMGLLIPIGDPVLGFCGFTIPIQGRP